MKIEGTNKDGEKIAEELAGLTMGPITEKDLDFLRKIHEQITNTKLCKRTGCIKTRANGSSRCLECSEKYRQQKA